MNLDQVGSFPLFCFCWGAHQRLLYVVEVVMDGGNFLLVFFIIIINNIIIKKKPKLLKIKK